MRMSKPAAAIKAQEHWTNKDGGVKLFLYEKCAGDPAKTNGTILFVHGSSMASQPTFDLQVPGRPDSSAMDHFARLGYDCWSVDMEGYGRSTKTATTTRRFHKAPTIATPPRSISRNCAANGPSSSTGFPRARCARRCLPSGTRRWWRGSRSTPWSGPAKARRRSSSGARSCPNSSAKNRRPMDKAFIHSMFDRDHPDTAERKVIEAFADAVVALDDSVPTGTYVDMCSKLPVVDPDKITVPTLIMRGQFDGIASMQDL